MFERLLSFLGADTAHHTKMPEADARHVMGALLVRVAKADNAYLFEEVEEIDHMLADLYDLNAVEAAKMRAECEKLEGHLPEVDVLRSVLASGIAPETRAEMVRALWAVADADGRRVEKELQVVAFATDIMGLSPEEAANLRT